MSAAPVLRRASADDFHGMSLAAARAFATNECYQFLWSHLPTPEQRVAANAWQLERRMWLCDAMAGSVFVATVDGAPVGTIAFGSSSSAATLWQRLRSGLWLRSWWFGAQAQLNFEAMLAALDAQHERALGEACSGCADRPPSCAAATPVVTVDLKMVTVVPEMAGRGLGTQLLCLALAEIKRQHSGARVRVLVDTQEEYAAKWYAKHGFSIVDDAVLVPLPGQRFRNILMQQTL